MSFRLPSQQLVICAGYNEQGIITLVGAIVIPTWNTYGAYSWGMGPWSFQGTELTNTCNKKPGSNPPMCNLHNASLTPIPKSERMPEVSFYICIASRQLVQDPLTETPESRVVIGDGGVLKRKG
jgi:hypothetical protein